MINYLESEGEAEMSIAAEKLPLPRRDVRKKKLPRRCRDATAYKKSLPRRDGLQTCRCRDGFRKHFSNFTATDVLDQIY